jgi:hypothetical protein
LPSEWTGLPQTCPLKNRVCTRLVDAMDGMDRFMQGIKQYARMYVKRECLHNPVHPVHTTPPSSKTRRDMRILRWTGLAGNLSTTRPLTRPHGL